MNLYETLELQSNASQQDIKKAYYNLSKKYHPDKCKDDNATEKFQKINTAYQILMDDKNREKYLKMSINEKCNFIKLLEKIFSNSLKIDELSEMGINIKNLVYFQNNFKNIMNSINYKELFNLFLKGVVPETYKQNSNCSDSEVESWDESQAEYYYDMPIKYSKQNKLDIKLVINLSLTELIEQNKKKIKIKRNLEDEETLTTFIFNIEKPYIIFNSGGDMDDGDYGDLIIQLCLPQNFYWKQDLIIYDYSISLYQMIYGLNININVGKQIHYDNWIPYRDGFLITVDDIYIRNHCFAIKLSLNYDHNNEKEEILKSFFN